MRMAALGWGSPFLFGRKATLYRIESDASSHAKRQYLFQKQSTCPSFNDEQYKRKTQPRLQSCKLRLRPKSHLQHIVAMIFIKNATRNPGCISVISWVFGCNPVGGFFFFIFYYIIYNIYTYIIIYIEYIHYRYIQEKTWTNESCGLRFCLKSCLQHTVDAKMGATRNLQPATFSCAWRFIQRDHFREIATRYTTRINALGKNWRKW